MDFKLGDKVLVDGLRDYRTVIDAIYEDKVGFEYRVRWTNKEGSVQRIYYPEVDIKHV